MSKYNFRVKHSMFTVMAISLLGLVTISRAEEGFFSKLFSSEKEPSIIGTWDSTDYSFIIYNPSSGPALDVEPRNTRSEPIESSTGKVYWHDNWGFKDSYSGNVTYGAKSVIMDVTIMRTPVDVANASLGTSFSSLRIEASLVDNNTLEGTIEAKYMYLNTIGAPETHETKKFLARRRASE